MASILGWPLVGFSSPAWRALADLPFSYRCHKLSNDAAVVGTSTRTARAPSPPARTKKSARPATRREREKGKGKNVSPHWFTRHEVSCRHTSSWSRNEQGSKETSGSSQEEQGRRVIRVFSLRRWVCRGSPPPRPFFFFSFLLPVLCAANSPFPCRCRSTSSLMKSTMKLARQTNTLSTSLPRWVSKRQQHGKSFGPCPTYPSVVRQKHTYQVQERL